MKKVMSLLLSVILIISITACSSGQESPGQNISYSSATTYIPDLSAFMKTPYGQQGVNSNSDIYFVSCTLTLDEGKVAINEYMNLLLDSRFNLSLQPSEDEHSFTFEGREWHDYFYTYTGTSTNVEEHLASTNDVLAHIYLLVGYNYNDSTASISMHYHKGFALIDTGDRASVDSGQTVSTQVGQNSSSQGSFSSSWGSQSKNCRYCNNSGYITCSTCSGLGYYYVTGNTPYYNGLGSSGGSYREKKDCPSFRCIDGKEKCTHCNY